MSNLQRLADERLRHDYVSQAGKPHVRYSAGDGGWVAFIPGSDLPMGFGENPQKALDQMLAGVALWIKGAGQWTPFGTYE